MKIVAIRKIKLFYFLIFILIGIITNAQKIQIWNKKLNTNIILHQKVSNDSTWLLIDKKENKWLGKDVNIKTVNYWNNAPIDITANCKTNILVIKRTFLGNSIVGDKLYFKKNKNKYYFHSLKEFEQKKNID
ncbi:hypothetical protein OK18_01045 [Chryseobacterium gallinarum]|uniref:Uncharacterized protein n=1 Tax=Chryseobacterium gallinarum TaxID=1324352 RepID=A0A0G3LWR6_CHRGL|nr:hypothetical protein [Chryseobacterium gallinarum]AKK71411.1 hypothetical protein OK18_01045 [Chryseobacterium gallinarum]